MIGNLNKKIGIRLRFVREEAGLNRNQMSELLDISPAQYSKIERGESELNIEKLHALRIYMGVDPLFMVTGENRSKPSVNSDTDNNHDAVEMQMVKELFYYCKKEVSDDSEIPGRNDIEGGAACPKS